MEVKITIETNTDTIPEGLEERIVKAVPTPTKLALKQMKTPPKIVEEFTAEHPQLGRLSLIFDGNGGIFIKKGGLTYYPPFSASTQRLDFTQDGATLIIDHSDVFEFKNVQTAEATVDAILGNEKEIKPEMGGKVWEIMGDVTEKIGFIGGSIVELKRGNIIRTLPSLETLTCDNSNRIHVNIRGGERITYTFKNGDAFEAAKTIIGK